MNRIIYIGMDVHTTNYTFCSLEPVFGGEDKILGVTQAAPGCKSVLKYIAHLKKRAGDDTAFICGYEAGCLGYTLYRQLTAHGIQCVILAPTTMMVCKGKRIKTDRRDAKVIAQCLAYGTYSPVYVPTEEDAAVKQYIRMRDDHKAALKKIKQQNGAFCLHNGYEYEGRSKWTLLHLRWLRTLKLERVLQEVLDGYLLTYQQLSDGIETFDRRIEELASGERYAEKVKRLTCFLGVKTPTALATIVETGDFSRFPKGNVYSSYLGLTPGEDSSGGDINRGGISKAGNTHVRRLLIEASQGICKGKIGQKSKELKARQQGNPPPVIAYADKANVRMRKKYYRMISHEKKKNVAVTAVARELSCFIWGMMTDNITEGA
ncbi:IS110 family transposase [Blautia hominis]|uniref:IS110 family transposase n=1 Tax=Blautia hominis TaxID=2025493 RepID=A0ABQ0BFI0_9FIRM